MLYTLLGTFKIMKEQIDYKKKYYELYEKVAKLLVENRNEKKPYTPQMLLMKWDMLRDK